MRQVEIRWMPLTGAPLESWGDL